MIENEDSNIFRRLRLLRIYLSWWQWQILTSMFLINFVKYFFRKWWRPLLFLVLTVGLIYISEQTKSVIFQNVCYSLFFIAVFCLLISSVVQLVNKRWLQAIATFLIFCLTVGAFIFFAIALFFIDQETPDRFADNLKIPNNIQIDTPLDLTFDNKRPDTINKIIKQKTDFQLYNSFQQGLYEYDFWTSKIERGIIYLKAYEITHNYPLSIDRLPVRSVVRVFNPSDTIKRFSTNDNFTIYEGDWDKPYAAKFEVWFKPINGGQERKLFKKNYKITGWMR